MEKTPSWCPFALACGFAMRLKTSVGKYKVKGRGRLAPA